MFRMVFCFLCFLFLPLGLTLAETRIVPKTNQAAKKKITAKKKTAVKKQSSFSQAVLLNGGGSARSNYYSHILYLRLMRKELQKQGLLDKDITIFSGDGEKKDPDQAIIAQEYKKKDAWLFAHRREMRLYRQKPKLINTKLKNKKLLESTTKNFTKTLQELAKKKASSTKPMFLFVTDHGTQNPKEKHVRNQMISMWNEDMTVKQYHKALRGFGKNRVVSVMSQCFSGGFKWSIYRKPGRFGIPLGNRCGFYATLPDRYSYGCFPQTKLKNHIGHAYRFITAMSVSSTMNQAHEHALVNDITPDIPVRSSDLYLRELLTGDAKADNVKLTVHIKALMKKYAGKSYPGLQRDLQLIGEIAKKFGMARPTTFHAFQIQEKNLQKKLRWFNRVKNMWANVFASARSFHLKTFMKRNTALQQQWSLFYPKRRLKKKRRGRKKPKAVAKRKAPVKKWSKEKFRHALLEGFRMYVHARPHLYNRLKLLYTRKKMMADAAFQLEIKQAALLRMKILFIRIAGRTYLEHSDIPELVAHKEGLKRLVACEHTKLTTKRKGSLKSAPFVAPKVEKIPLPSWFGISFRPASKKKYPFVTEGAVTVETVYMNTPAESAGIKEGDIILSIGEKSLLEPYEIRERVMLSPAGKKISFLYVRNGKLKEGKVVFRRLNEPPPMKLRPIVGLALTSLLQAKSLQTKNALPDLRKKVSLLFFWATWCGPCKAALPALRKLQKKYKQQGLTIVTISDEKKSILTSWLKKKPAKFLPFVNVYDTKRSLSRHLRIRATPTFVVIKEGKVVLSKVGYSKISVFEKKLKKLLY